MDNIKSISSNVSALVSNDHVNLASTGMVPERDYSPLTLAQGWPIANRLILVLILTCIGTIINGFFITSFFIERTLNKISYVFMACAGLSEFVVTSVIMPTVSVVLLSGQWDTPHLCRCLQFIYESGAYAYSMFYALLAMESYYRFCCSLGDYCWFMSMRIRFMCTSVYAMSISAAAVGVFFDLDYDYCERRKYGNYDYRLLSSTLFLVIPSIIAFFGLFASLFGISRRINTYSYYRRSKQSEIDFGTTCVNIAIYALHILLWTPYLSVIYLNPDNDNATFYHYAWLGLCRSIFTSALYAIFIKNFRRAFVNLFKYCFCKNSLPTLFYMRRRDRAVEYNVTASDVRILMAPSPRFVTPLHAPSGSEEETQL